MDKDLHYGQMLIKHRGEWVALSHDAAKVVASGKSLMETIKKAEKTQEKEPIYVMVSKEVGNFSYSS